MKVKIIVIVILSLMMTGCATTAKRYSIEEYIKGQKVKVDVLTIDGIGAGKYPDGAGIEGKPIIQFPQLPPIEYRKD